MSILKVIATVAIVATLSIGAQAANPKTETKTEAAKTTEVVATPAETNTTAGTAVFTYNGTGDINNAANYSLTPVSNPDDLCQGTTSRCAATFNTNSAGHPTGTAMEPTWEKD